jgi:transcriptional regulator with XRE-family HTH domain
MQWQGNILKERLAAASITQAALAEAAGVSRQTVVDWINGQVPKGSHLLAMCRLLDLDADVLFAEDEEDRRRVIVPVHRRRRNAKITADVREASRELAMEYEGLLTSQALPFLTPVLRPGSDAAAAAPLARELRLLAGLEDENRPADYSHVLRLMEKLGICLVVRTFPESIKSYAFYTAINSQRAVFVNASTNLLDLIFPLLHEAVHAVRGIPAPGAEYSDDEERLCDGVAGLVQFPDGYVDLIESTIRDLTPAQQVLRLKTFAEAHHHCCYGVVRRIQDKHGSVAALNVHGADGKLRKLFPAIGEVILPSGTTEEQYLRNLAELSPLFLRALQANFDHLSTSLLARCLDMSVMDAKDVRNVLLARRGGVARACAV